MVRTVVSAPRELRDRELMAYNIKKADPDRSAEEVMEIMGCKVTTDTVRRWIRGAQKKLGLEPVKRPITYPYAGIKVADIVEKVSADFGVSVSDLRSRKREHHLTIVRHYAMWKAYTETGRSTTQIGRWFNRDHTTALYGIRKIELSKGVLVDADSGAPTEALRERARQKRNPKPIMFRITDRSGVTRSVRL